MVASPPPSDGDGWSLPEVSVQTVVHYCGPVDGVPSVGAAIAGGLKAGCVIRRNLIS